MSDLRQRLAGKTIVVTGAAQGLGEAIAHRLAAEGAAVAIADLQADGAREAASRLERAGHQAIGLAVDVGDRASVCDMLDAVVARFGGIDVLFNNAGFNKPLPFLDIDEDNFSSIIRVNALGVLIGTQEAARRMIARGTGGKIVNTASIAGRQGYADFASYCASKAAVISLTQAAARALSPHRITVNGFAPGVVRTPLWEQLEDDMIRTGQIDRKGDYIESFSASILVGAPARAEELAGVGAFLASSDADHLTGQTVMCDGGMVLV